MMHWNVAKLQMHVLGELSRGQQLGREWTGDISSRDLSSVWRSQKEGLDPKPHLPISSPDSAWPTEFPLCLKRQITGFLFPFTDVAWPVKYFWCFLVLSCSNLLHLFLQSNALLLFCLFLWANSLAVPTSRFLVFPSQYFPSLTGCSAGPSLIPFRIPHLLLISSAKSANVALTRCWCVRQVKAVCCSLGEEK